MIKKVIVESQKGFKIFRKNIKPGDPIDLNLREIFKVLHIGKGIKIFEVLPNGELLRLNKYNYDKVNSTKNIIISFEDKDTHQNTDEPESLLEKTEEDSKPSETNENEIHEIKEVTVEEKSTIYETSEEYFKNNQKNNNIPKKANKYRK